MTVTATARQPVPAIAALLGAAGLIPFLTGAAYLLFGPLVYAQVITTALVGYGAVILSFMGAVHWGLGLALTGAARRYRLVISVVPALVGWGALLVVLLGGHLLAFTLLVAGFLAVLLLDLGAVRAGLAPPWYRRLRLALTLVVVACLGAAGAMFI